MSVSISFQHSYWDSDNKQQWLRIYADVNLSMNLSAFCAECQYDGLSFGAADLNSFDLALIKLRAKIEMYVELKYNQKIIKEN